MNLFDCYILFYFLNFIYFSFSETNLKRHQDVYCWSSTLKFTDAVSGAIVSSLMTFSVNVYTFD